MHDARTGKSRLEMPTLAGGRPQLHLCLDEGSIGLPTVLYLFLTPVVRSTFHPDPAHRVMNNVTNSSNMSGLWIRILEVLVVLNLPTKPYNTDAQWHTMVGASKDFLGMAGPDNEDFQALYAAIVTEENDGRLPKGFASKEHMRATWARMGEASFLCARGRR